MGRDIRHQMALCPVRVRETLENLLQNIHQKGEKMIAYCMLVSFQFCEFNLFLLIFGQYTRFAMIFICSAMEWPICFDFFVSHILGGYGPPP